MLQTLTDTVQRIGINFRNQVTPTQNTRDNSKIDVKASTVGITTARHKQYILR